MQLGQVVDFCIAYNERQKAAEQAEKRAENGKAMRKATQAEIDAFLR